MKGGKESIRVQIRKDSRKIVVQQSRTIGRKI